MLRTIITIDAEKCNGCGLCVTACHEGAIGLENGKAVLLRDDYCDGLGNCLPACPTQAISFEEREALAYDEAAVMENIRLREEQGATVTGCPGSQPLSVDMPGLTGGCPGSQARSLDAFGAPTGGCPGSQAQTLGMRGPSFGGIAPAMPARNAAPFAPNTTAGKDVDRPSALRQWPVQIRLVPVHAPYFDRADLLIAADCTAYARADFHETFMRDKITIIGCPKLDTDDYAVKLTEILRNNDIHTVTVARMSVPCCGGIEQAVARAVRDSGKDLPVHTVTVTPEGHILPG